MNYRRVAALVLFVFATALVGCSRRPPEPAKTPPAVVVVDRPVIQQVIDYEDFAGRTEPFKVVVLKSRVTGNLKRILFKDGQDVKAGDPLFEIDNRSYKAEVDRAKASVEKSKAHLKQAKAEYDRVQGDFDKGVAGRAALDLAIGDWEAAIADVDIAKAALTQAETNLSYCTIVAPFNGRLSKRMVDEENLVKGDETVLTTIVYLDYVYATYDVDERTVIRVRKLIESGQVTSSREKKLFVRIGLADEDGFSRSGEVTFSDNQIDSGTGTLRLRATIENPRSDRPPHYFLSPGMFVRVHVPIGNPRFSVLVPEKAIGSDQGQKFVYVVNGEKKVERRNVRVGQQHDDLRVIEDGVIGENDRVIVDGLLRVRPGIEVNPTFAPPALTAFARAVVAGAKGAK